MSLISLLAAAAFAAGPSTLFDFSMKGIDGKDVPLSKFKGDVVLVVNVASKCGLTPQYIPLEKMYRDNRGMGFAVLGFPANQFGSQEPGTDVEINQFCTAKYGVTFPMFSKIVVKGEGLHPLYKWLLDNDGRDDDIEWNFAKFLVGRDGKVIASFPSKMAPDAPEIATALAKALAAKR